MADYVPKPVVCHVCFENVPEKTAVERGWSFEEVFGWICEEEECLDQCSHEFAEDEDELLEDDMNFVNNDE